MNYLASMQKLNTVLDPSDVNSYMVTPMGYVALKDSEGRNSIGKIKDFSNNRNCKCSKHGCSVVRMLHECTSEDMVKWLVELGPPKEAGATRESRKAARTAHEAEFNRLYPRKA